MAPLSKKKKIFFFFFAFPPPPPPPLTLRLFVQETEDAKSNVQTRLGFIGAELKQLETTDTELTSKKEQIVEQLQQLDAKLKAAAPKK